MLSSRCAEEEKKKRSSAECMYVCTNFFRQKRSMHLAARTRELNGTFTPRVSHGKTRRGIVSNHPDEHRRAESSGLFRLHESFPARCVCMCVCVCACVCVRAWRTVAALLLRTSRPYFFFAGSLLGATGLEGAGEGVGGVHARLREA